jgi:hypothetical protein
MPSIAVSPTAASEIVTSDVSDVPRSRMDCIRELSSVREVREGRSVPSDERQSLFVSTTKSR